MPASSVTVTLDVRNVDAVKRVRDRASELVEAIADLKAFAPGTVDPIVLRRANLQPVFVAVDALAAALGAGDVAPPELPVAEPEAEATGRFEVIVPHTEGEAPGDERVALRTDDQALAIGVAQQRFGRVFDTETQTDVEVPSSV